MGIRVGDADGSVGHKARDGGSTVTVHRIGPHEALEADDDVREVRRRVESPTPAPSGAPINVDLGETVRKLGPALRGAPILVDNSASHGVVVRLRGADGLNDAVNHQIPVDILPDRDSVIVGVPGYSPARCSVSLDKGEPKCADCV